MFRKVKKIHFVGIGGIGMSGIAELLLNLDFEISGSDIQDSEIIQNLIAKGAKIYTDGHKAGNIGDSEVLVYSSAVRGNNPEILEAKDKGIPVIRRAEMLGELIAVKATSIGVSGTHGKTSTSSMVGSVLNAADLDLHEHIEVHLKYDLTEDSWKKSSPVDEENLTIYKAYPNLEACQKVKSIGDCCTDCDFNMVMGCIEQCGYYVVGEN